VNLHLPSDVPSSLVGMSAFAWFKLPKKRQRKRMPQLARSLYKNDWLMLHKGKMI